MKFKKVLSILLVSVIFSLIAFSGCNNQNNNNGDVSSTSKPEQASQVSQVSQTSEISEVSKTNPDENVCTPAMWKVTSDDGKEIYMMGSIHVADKAVENMPDYFENIYSKCNALAFEIDISEFTDNLSESLQLMKSLMYTDGTTIKDHISNDTYKKSVQVLKDNNMYSSAYDYFMPVFWTSLIENVIYKESGLSTEYGVDTVLTERAKKDKKKLLEVESAEFQVDLLSGFSDSIQEMLLQQYAADNAIEEQTKAINDLYSEWKKGTFDAESTGAEADTSGLSEEELKIYEEYNKAMLIDRNIGMADKAEEYMNSSDKVLLVVGSAHFYGDDGILKLMENRGYTVTQITDENVSSLMAA